MLPTTTTTTTTTTVAAIGGRHCDVFVAARSGARGLPVILEMAGTGELTPRITAVLLSATPAGSMAQIVSAQAETDGGWAAYSVALAKNDDAFFRRHSGIGAATMTAMLELPPLTSTFAELAAAGVTTRLTLFHGRAELAVPVTMVKQLQSDNEQRQRLHQPFLELTLREYLGGHSLDLGALHDCG